MEFRTEQAHSRYDEVVGLARELVVALDFDGTLSPIVEDPGSAVIHTDAPDALGALAAEVRAVVVITGRPARQVVQLGHLEALADSLPATAHLAVMGQYGQERWDSNTREFTSPEPPEELHAFRDELPGLLREQDAGDALVEEKGLAVAIHTRQLPDPKAAFARLEEALRDAADRHGLLLEPGRLVLEVRSGAGMHKGIALREALEKYEGAGVVFVGDDLGDLEAFQAVEDLREHGVPSLLVCSSSDEQEALAALSDVLVPGPPGVVDLLAALAEAARAAR
jgi:trehalose 6-phosphate phosphatase